MEKDIHFTEKKVDESWKDQAFKDKGSAEKSSRPAPSSNDDRKGGAQSQTSKIFLTFASSLGIQALMHLGEMPNPETNKPELNLEAAKEIVDLLIAIKEKTQGNLSAEERQFFESFLPELQMKFARKV